MINLPVSLPPLAILLNFPIALALSLTTLTSVDSIPKEIN
jgi:hypothetical protein